MKYAHKLTKNKAIQKPSRLIFTDTETLELEHAKNIFYHRLKLGCAIFTNIRNNDKTNDRYLNYTTKKEFWDNVDSFCKDKTRTYLYCHNQHFDFSVLAGSQELPARNWILKNFFINSNCFIMRFKKDKKTLFILDSGNIVKVSLDEIGMKFKLPKLKIDFKTVSMEELAIYCERDTKILRAFVLAFRDFVIKHDLGNFRFTIASQSFTAFRHRFMKHDIFIHDNEEVIALERESYRGGINEAYFIGVLDKEIYRSVDVNSLYAYVMRNNKFPTKLKWFTRQMSIDYLQDILIDYAVTSRVLVDIDEPVFPYKTDKVYYPLGKFVTVLTTPQLKYAISKNWIKEIMETAIYEQEYIFKEYVDFFYDLKRYYKKEKDSVYYMITKLFLNSLTGKWGQRSQKYIEIGDCNDWEYSITEVGDLDTHEHWTEIRIGGKIYREGKKQESFDSFVAIVSHITAYAREHTIKLRYKAGVENTFYIDTDSLTVNEKGYHNLKSELDEFELGKLQVQEIANKVIIRGAKDYKFGDKEKIKGIRKDAVYLGNNQYSQFHFMKTRSMMRLGIQNRAIMKRVTKKLKRQYDKGSVSNNGFVTPYMLPRDLNLLTAA